MTSALYLEHYLDSLEHLPIELQRNFTLMRDLDARAQALMRNIDRLADDYLRNVKTLLPEKKKEQMSNIQSLFNKAKEYGDDKVQLAIQTYELCPIEWFHFACVGLTTKPKGKWFCPKCTADRKKK